ncbi:MAG TPA: efflux RND transporter periplasmic adaptor subunit [Vicinamibacteria bacterium]
MSQNTLPLLALAAAAVSTACGGGTAASAGRPQRPALRVRVAPVEVQDVVYQIKSLGQIEARDVVQVTAQVEGVATDVRFREGDQVGPGTVLLRIDPDRYRLEVERARAVLAQSRAEQDRAEADLKRREALAQNDLLSVEELTRSRGETARLAASVDVAQAALGIAQQNLQRSEVRPQVSGVIDTRTVDTGLFVRTGTVLATIVDSTRLRLRFRVSEAESLRATVGGSVTFRVAPLGPRDFTARIYHVGRIADPTTRQVEVLGWVDNLGDLKPGFFAEVTLSGERREHAIVVPESAIQASEQGFVTYAVEGGQARLRPIQLGLRTGTGIVEILSGLKPGETVVTEGSDRLADGIPVEVVTGEEPRPAEGAPAPKAPAGK